MTSALWTLAPAGAVAGAVLMWAFRRIADGAGLREAAKRIQAYLLEFWLFVDEPSVVWKSWKGLLLANARFLRLLLVPLVVLSVPTTPLYFLLDALYGESPLAVGKPALVTAQLHQALDRLAPVPQLNPPEGISVESPPVHVFGERQISWRVRPLRPVSGNLALSLAGSRMEKSVEAGPGRRLVSRRRTQSLVELVRYPTEAPLGAGPVEWIEVSYPSATVPALGVDVHWTVWFIAFSLVGAALSPGRLE
jgi:hypothetical protein